MATLTIESFKQHFANLHISHFTKNFLWLLNLLKFDSVVYESMKYHLRDL